MRSLVVYESMFGNSEAVAHAIADGMSTLVDVRVVPVQEATAAPGLAALIVGAPTHAFTLSRPATRRSALDQGAIGDPSLGLREWLAAAPRLAGLPAAAFDTRIDKPYVPGSAARSAERRLRRLGCLMLLPAESFLVAGVAGPLMDGELDRAHRWGRRVAGQLTVPQGV